MERRTLFAAAGSSIFVSAVAKGDAASSNKLPGAAEFLRDMTRWGASNPQLNRELFEFAEILDRIEPNRHGFTINLGEGFGALLHAASANMLAVTMDGDLSP